MPPRALGDFSRPLPDAGSPATASSTVHDRPAAAVVWTARPDGASGAANASWQAFTGQSAEQYLGWGWLDAVHPDDRDRLRNEWTAAVRSLTVVSMRYRLRRHDGEYRRIWAQAQPAVVDGQVREWVGMCLDVTDSERVGQALRESEERFRFLDRLGEATRALNDAAQLMAVSARLLGEHLGATRCAYADVEADNDRFTIRSDWAVPGMASSAGVYSLDLFGPQATSNLRNGRIFVVRDVDRELGDDGGARMFNAIHIKAIITAPLVKQGRLVAMMAVHQSAPRDWCEQDISLVAEVVDRCWAHIERVRDTALLREQDRHKDEFLATLAHELRNPLAPMRFALSMMRLSEDPGRALQARDIIDRQVGHMARLIDDLLDLSRINRGLIDLQREVVGLRELLLQAAEAARPAIDAASHRLHLNLPADDLMLLADPARIVQMVGNLLNNAAKYTLDGGDIRLAAWRSGAYAVIEVADTGIGIPPEQQGRLFQMFTQLNHTAQRAKGGLGIGLSLVKRLALMHGGKVGVFSRGLDEGSTFTIELPLAGLPRIEPMQPADPMPAEALGTSQPLRVLVVEDNEDGRVALVALLELLGYTVGQAATGLDGVIEAQRFQPDVVLLDLGLPGIDGYEVAGRLRAEPSTAGATLIALTGWGAARDREQTQRAGFDDHLTKPIEPGELTRRLQQAARDRGRR